MGLVQDFGTGVGKAIWPLAEPKIDAAIADFKQIAVNALSEFRRDALALIPLVGATVVKVALEQAFDKIPGIEVPKLDTKELLELAQGDLSKMPDIDIKGLSNVFDLTEFLAGLGGR